MDELESLYTGTLSENPHCQGCSVLNLSKPAYSIMDYEDLEKSPVLFVSNSFFSKYGKTAAFTKHERSIIERGFPGTDFQYTAAVKCPGVKDDDMSPKDRELCRKHLSDTIEKVRPKVIVPCGNLAFKMLTKKSGIMSKRGSSFSYTSQDGYECVVVPIYPPFLVEKEPTHRFLFDTDLHNIYSMYVLGQEPEKKFKYRAVMDLDSLVALGNLLRATSEDISCDVETTGLDFTTCKIMSVSFSTREETWAIPVEHKDSPFLDNLETVLQVLKLILENPNNRKIYHNGKFDVKFFLRYGIHPVNMWDTKVMHHFINETAPKGLMDLVKLYFPEELEYL